VDIQAYIASGILESYVLGELNSAEAREVEDMAARYPEVREELTYIEETLEAVAQSAAVTPPAHMRASILDAIAPAAPAAKPVQEASVRPLHQTPATASARPQPQRWLMAASISLALISSLAAAYFWSRWKQSEERLATLAAQNTVLVQNVSTLENRARGMEQSLAVLTNPTYQTVAMKGLAPAPDAQAVVYWNPATEEVYLNPGSLPTPPSGKQYQLWAIVDGKPVDAGVFDTTGQQLQKMKEIENASAFAVTLEPAGGSPSPTMDQMYVMGEAS
jgi:anti-sigma-K factor RskA